MHRGNQACTRVRGSRQAGLVSRREYLPRCVCHVVPPTTHLRKESIDSTPPVTPCKDEESDLAQQRVARWLLPPLQPWLVGAGAAHWRSRAVRAESLIMAALMTDSLPMTGSAVPDCTGFTNCGHLPQGASSYLTRS